MSLLAQLVVGEPSIIFFGSTLVAGVAWTLKKVLDIDSRLTRMEERCLIHRQDHEP